MQTPPAECGLNENGCPEKRTEMQADGGRCQTINLTMRAETLWNCTVTARPGVCVSVGMCVCVCVRATEGYVMQLCAINVLDTRHCFTDIYYLVCC